MFGSPFLLADPRSEALATRFASLWLRLQDLDKVRPDAFWFPNYSQQLTDAMRRETELLFLHLVREDRSLLDLLSADYSFLNERLARHYGMPGVVGEEFRRVEYPDDRRRGLFGHGPHSRCRRLPPPGERSQPQPKPQGAPLQLVQPEAVPVGTGTDARRTRVLAAGLDQRRRQEAVAARDPG